MANPYIAYSLLIYAGLDGIERGLTAGEPNNANLFTAENDITDGLVSLPDTLEKAKSAAKNSEFIKKVLPEGFAESI